MIKTASLGFPRIGANRELKKAVESFWKKSSNEVDLKKSAQEIRHNNWQLQQKSGIDFIPSNDFSFYDQVLDNIALFGACVLMDGSLSVINNLGEYIQLIESDSLFVDNI